MDIAAVVIAALCIVVGIVGTVLPIVPGLILAWLGVVVYGLLTGFGIVGWIVLGVETLLLVLAYVAAVRVPMRVGAGKGIPRRALFAGAGGAVVGFFVIPIVGVFVGGAIGVLLAEAARHRDTGSAWKATKDVLAAFGWSTAVQFGFGVAMGAVWLAWALVDVIGS